MIRGLTPWLLGLSACVGLPVVGLALASGTSWMVVPGHLGLTVLVVIAAFSAALEGRPGYARALVALHVLVSVAAAAALDLGSHLRGESVSWLVPWVAMLAWGWIGPLAAAAAIPVGNARARSIRRDVVRRRKLALLLRSSGQDGG